MLRLNELKLPLDHTDADLTQAVIERLGIGAKDLLDVSIFKRSYDARKKSQIVLIYQLDLTLAAATEEMLLARPIKIARLQPSPNIDYEFVAHASADFPQVDQQRPLVIGFGPCGLLAALLLFVGGGGILRRPK